MSQFIEMFGNPVNNSKSWPTKAIMEVAPEQPSKKQMPGKVWLLNLDMIESNTGKVIEKVYETSDNTLSVQPFDEDNVLFSKLRPYLNKVVVPDEYGLATTELVPLRPNQEVLNKVFLSYLLRSQQFVTFANKISGGTKMPRMPLAELRNFKCILPPMSEQLKFVSIAKQADKSKFGDFKSQFIEMFKNIPSVKIADCCITVSGGTPNTKKIEYYDGGDIPWLSSGEINQGYIFSTDKYITQLGLENSSAKWVPANSVVIAMYGATAGKVGFIKIPLTTNQAVCTLLPNDGFEPLYLYYATLSKTSWMISQCRGAAQPNISQSIIRSMEIPMATIDEQKRFCKLLTQADKSKSYVWIALKNLESMLGYYIRQVA